MKYIVVIIAFTLITSCGLYYVANPQVRTIKNESAVLPVNSIIKTQHSSTIYYFKEDGVRKKIYSDYALIRNSRKVPESFEKISKIPKNSAFVITEYIREFDGQHAWYYVKFESTDKHFKQYPIVRMIGRNLREVEMVLNDFTW
jgi:hypothetical protein